MSSEFRKRIIEEEIDDESVTEVLQSIRDFKLGLIRSITKTDIETIARYGFGKNGVFEKVRKTANFFWIFSKKLWEN